MVPGVLKQNLVLFIVKAAKGFAHVLQRTPPACEQQIVEQKVGNFDQQT